MNPQDVPDSPDSPSRYGDTAHVMFLYCEEQRKHKAAANRGSDYSITISSTLAQAVTLRLICISHLRLSDVNSPELDSIITDFK